MTAFEKIKVIEKFINKETMSPDMDVSDGEFLLKAFYVMRDIAIYDDYCGWEEKVDQEFEERMSLKKGE